MTEERQGLIQIYTGDGKGKSTASFGLALRAAGAGLRVAIIQFMKKGEWYGEINSFARFPEIRIQSFGSNKFVTKGAPADPENLELAAAAMEQARLAMDDDSVDLLILDELCNAVYFGLVSEEAALELISAKPSRQELIITGRNATAAMIDRADLVTEMREIKHPYQRGIPARKGIEY